MVWLPSVLPPHLGLLGEVDALPLGVKLRSLAEVDAESAGCPGQLAVRWHQLGHANSLG